MPSELKPSLGGKLEKRELILRALIEPEFRELLQTSPEKALGKKRLTEKNLQEVRFVLRQIEVIEFHIGSLADELLCACSVTAVGGRPIAR